MLTVANSLSIEKAQKLQFFGKSMTKSITVIKILDSNEQTTKSRILRKAKVHYLDNVFSNEVKTIQKNAKEWKTILQMLER